MNSYSIQICEISNKNFDYGVANQLHGYLYESLGSILNHDGIKKEFSQYVKITDTEANWILHILNKELVPYIEIFMKLLDTQTIKLSNLEFKVISAAPIITNFSESELYTLTFVTPYFFKNKKSSKYFTRFSINHLIFQLSKLNPNLKTKEIVENLQLININVSPQIIKFQKQRPLGMTGQIQLRYTGNQTDQLQKSLNLLTINGYGVKTSLGYGGVELNEGNS